MAEKLPAANLLLLQRLLSLLQRIGHNASTSRMTSSNLAVCLGPNLLSPPNEDQLPLEAMLEVTAKVRCREQAAAAFPHHQSLAVQRSLAASSVEPMLRWGGCLAEQPHSHSLLRRGRAQQCERLLDPFSGPWLETKALLSAGERAGGVHD